MDNLIKLLFDVKDLKIEELEQNLTKFLWDVRNNVGIYNKMGHREMIAILKLVQSLMIGSNVFAEFDKKWNRNLLRDIESLCCEFEITANERLLTLTDKVFIENFRGQLSSDNKSLRIRSNKLKEANNLYKKQVDDLKDIALQSGPIKETKKKFTMLDPCYKFTFM